jgi:hypothetical protein
MTKQMMTKQMMTKQGILQISEKSPSEEMNENNKETKR